MCLICLKEIQKYWRINNNVLDIFFQYLDASIADRLHAKQLYAGNGHPGFAAAAATHSETAQTSLPPASFSISASMPWQQTMSTPSTTATATTTQELPEQQQQLQTPMMNFPGAANNVPDIIFDDQYFTNLMNGHWEADEKISELGLFLQAEDITGGRGWR